MIDALPSLAFIGPGGPEMLLVMLVLLVLFGAKDAPRIFRKLNDFLNHLRRTADSFKREVMYSDFKDVRPQENEPGVYDDYGPNASVDPGNENESDDACRKDGDDQSV